VVGQRFILVAVVLQLVVTFITSSYSSLDRVVVCAFCSDWVPTAGF